VQNIKGSWYNFATSVLLTPCTGTFESLGTEKQRRATQKERYGRFVSIYSLFQPMFFSSDGKLQGIKAKSPGINHKSSSEKVNSRAAVAGSGSRCDSHIPVAV